MGAAMSFARNTEIYGEGEPADYFYKVVSGSVRTSRILADGRRQIGAFYFPGDVFGLEAGEEHAFAAEAIAACRILVIKRSAATAAAARDAGIARELWTLTSRELQRAQCHVMLLIKTAQERVAGFLLEMAGRIRASDEFDLPMSRQDIADYLGLTIETVSRIFSGFEGTRTIALPTSRHVVLRDPRALRSLNS
jgi:CRP/FNR family nitrogen fixation transcriptional regulator